jgi:hypothetical protein
VANIADILVKIADMFVAIVAEIFQLNSRQIAKFSSGYISGNARVNETGNISKFCYGKLSV